MSEVTDHSLAGKQEIFVVFIVELPNRIKQSSFPECYPKMLIIIPESCYCPDNVNKADPNFEFAGHVGYQQTRCGNVKRDYKSSVYHFKFFNAEKAEVGCIFCNILTLCSS